MKKIIIFSLLAGFFLLLPIKIEAKQLRGAIPTLTPTPTPIPEYLLPYPGMLADHPLYKIKVLRDKIILFLTRDPQKKAERHLQMADKEFYSSLKLAEKGKIPLAKHTAFKAEHHLTLINTELRRAFYSGGKINEQFFNRLHQAGLKHQELIEGMKARADEEEQEGFQTIFEFSVRNDQAFADLEEEIKESQEELEELEEENSF